MYTEDELSKTESGSCDRFNELFEKYVNAELHPDLMPELYNYIAFGDYDDIVMQQIKKDCKRLHNVEVSDEMLPICLALLKTKIVKRYISND